MNRPDNAVAALILAAGKGTRMKSELPKVLHPVCGKPILERVFLALQAAGIQRFCTVLGGDLQVFQRFLTAYPTATACVQEKRQGTGDAVASAAPAFLGQSMPAYAAGRLLQGPVIDSPYVLICAADTPALCAKTLSDFLQFARERQADMAVLGMRHPTPKGYGRIVLSENGEVERIVEEKDATTSEKSINLCNSGVIFARVSTLFAALHQLTAKNAQNEFYLTDTLGLSRAAGKKVLCFATDHYQSFDGVNDRLQLAAIEQWLIRQKIAALMGEGVTFHLPETIYIEEDVQIGRDTDVGAHCAFYGKTIIGANCRIGDHVSLHATRVADGSVLNPFTYRVGP